MPAQAVPEAVLPSCVHPALLEELRRLGAPQDAEQAFSAGERAVLRRRKPIPVSLWAERHRVIHTSSRPGPWRNSVAPYLA
ncbi:MAG: hypothetical protein K6E40_10075, partial [Desulfovibrio sp.]|nr:hypothetical protein [Desulfovibrio sp.]